MTENYVGGRTGDLERELCARARWRLGVSSVSISSASSKSPNLLWSSIASSDPLGILFDVSLSFVGFVFVFGLFVCLFLCRLFVLTTIDLMANCVCYTNLFAVVHWLLTMM